jgi:hypothetical protein
MSAARTINQETGQEDAPPPAAKPPQASPDAMKQIAPMDQSMQAAKASRMGEGLLGFKKIEGSTAQPPRGWKGEMGPGKPANESGALGMPGQINSPEDISFNRSRFDQSLKQSKGDTFSAAQSSGAFASGNPIAHGTKSHMQRIFDSTDGDGVDVNTLDDGTKKRYKADVVRQTEEFGAYPGMDDPDSPAPPIRPLSYSFNSFTGKWVSPEGRESMLDRLGGQKGQKPIAPPPGGRGAVQ